MVLGGFLLLFIDSQVEAEFKLWRPSSDDREHRQCPLMSKDLSTLSTYIRFAKHPMSLSIRTLLIAGALLLSTVSSQGVPQLTGTWTTKSRKVVTGPVGTLLFYSCIQRLLTRREEFGRVGLSLAYQRLTSTGFLRPSK